MEDTDSVLLPIGGEGDVFRAGWFAWRLALRAGCDLPTRVRFAAAALSAASDLPKAVRISRRPDPPSLQVCAVPGDNDAADLFPAAINISLEQSSAEDGVDDPGQFSREIAEVLGTAASDKVELEAAKSLSASLEAELEETNRGVLALYAELDDRADKLRRADELKSRFLSYASHELRTPLNGIIGLVRLLKQGNLQQNSEENKQLAFIQQAAEQMREMVNDLLDLAKVEAGKVTVHPAEFGLDFVFGALRGIFRPLLQSEDVVLRFEDTSAVPAIYSDEAKVSQILRNFISNALKFTEHGEVRVWASAHNDLVYISVQDTGIGIAAENLGRIFEEYSQIEHPLQRRVRGTGLGLPLCRRLAELLGGRVDVASEPGKGSTFTLVLPRQYETGIRVSAKPGTPPVAHSRPTLLIIDDAEIDRYLLKELLKASGEYVILEAEDGQAGLDAAMRHKPEMIFLDLSLPKVDGIRVLSELRSSPATDRIPVVVVSARSISEQDRQQIESNALAVFDKARLSEARKLNIRLGPATAIEVVT